MASKRTATTIAALRVVAARWIRRGHPFERQPYIISILKAILRILGETSLDEGFQRYRYAIR